jgi:hypothetical protein
LVNTIRTEDPDRMIFADGLEWGRTPCPSLAGLGIGQALHCYDPMGVTHYMASWMEGSDAWPVPEWPSPLLNGFLYGTNKAEYQSPLVISGTIPPKSTVRVRIGTVSARSLLRLTADGTTVWEHDFRPGPGKGEWKSSQYRTEWNVYQNIYDRDYSIRLPAGASRLELLNVKGDWAAIMEIGIAPAGGTERVVRATDHTWGVRQTPMTFSPSDAVSPFATAAMLNRSWIAESLAPWLTLRSGGVPVMVQEFGFYNRTPHDAGLRWMEDCLSVWKENGLGWALWNLRGEFGILDSGRKDVEYADYRGHKLDAEMLALLRKY